ncbi:MAG: type III-B CRISPR module RAMP protein Cmr1 [Thermodesulfobacteriota bacterium]
MNRLELELEFLTPCFLSGADQRAVEMRPQSVKGVIRWWWRATAPSPNFSLERMKEQEALLFGSAELKLKSPLLVDVQSTGRMNVTDYGGHPWACGTKVRSGKHEVDALHYLAYGPVATVGKQEKTQDGRALDPKFNDHRSGRARSGLVLKRPAFSSGHNFSVSFTWRKESLTDGQQESLFQALAAWLTFGGLGSRSRKGWGALDLARVTGTPDALVKKALDKIDNYRKSFRMDGAGELEQLRPWPDVWKRRLCFKGSPQQDWKAALGEAGHEYKELKGAVSKQNRWIFGTADPRRASSVFVTVKKDEKGKLVGYIWAFPCTPDVAPHGGNIGAWKALLSAVRKH